MEQGIKKYQVNLVENNQLIINGKGDSQLWDKAVILDDFISPWDADKVLKIEFKALWDSTNLFFCFTVFDSSVHIDTTDDTIASINESDRVELFFRSDASLNPYYCLEIDPTPRVMDFIAYPNKKFDFDWNWPKNNLTVKSFRNENYFTVEGAISIESLRKFNLIKDNKIETGIFRAKYVEQDDSSFEPTWITWVNPNTETPNFHTPTSFGKLHLMQ